MGEEREKIMMMSRRGFSRRRNWDIPSGSRPCSVVKISRSHKVEADERYGR